MAESTREKGNNAFAAGDFEIAVELYTSALLAPDVEDLSALLSNRCAALVSLFRFDLALLDAEEAVRLRPEWSRAYARRGECLGALGEYDAAIQQYDKAITLTSDEAAVSRFEAAKTALQRRQKQLPVPIDYGKRVADLEKGGQTDFVVGGTAELVYQAWGWVEDGMAQIDRDCWKDEDGFGSKVPSGILALADAVLAHPLAFHIPGSRDSSLPLGEKLRLQYQYDIQAFSNQRYLIDDLSTAEIIDEFSLRAESDGWVQVRTALAHLIRGQCVMAFIEEATGAYVSAVIKYRYVLAILEEGLKRWANVSESKRGTTFTRTFKRSVQVALMLALEEGWSNGKNDDDRSNFTLEEIQAHAEEIMDDCVNFPTTQDPDNPTFFLTFQILPLVHAAKAIAFVLVHRSQLPASTTKVDSAVFFHKDQNAAASKMYSQAALYLPLDDPDRSVCLFLALNCALRAGNLTVADVFSQAAKAEAAMPHSEPVFGPAPRSFAVRLFVRKVCDDLRQLVQANGHGTLEATVLPVPQVTGGRIASLSKKAGQVEVQVYEAI